MTDQTRTAAPTAKTTRITWSDRGYKIMHGNLAIFETGDRRKAEGVLEYLTATRRPETHDAAIAQLQEG